LGATTTVNQGVDQGHARAQLAQVRQPAGDVAEPLAFARLPTTVDTQAAILAPVTALLWAILPLTGHSSRCCLL
jgi:hypothetical protein